MTSQPEVTVEPQSQADIIREKLKEKAKTYDLNIREQKVKAVKEIVDELPDVLANCKSEYAKYAAVSKFVPEVLSKLTNKPPPPKQVSGTGGGARVQARIAKKPAQPAGFDPTKPEEFAEQKAPELQAKLIAEQQQIMQTNEWALNYWQYLGVWSTLAMTLKAFKLPVPNKKQLIELSVQWATIHTKHHWVMPPMLEIAFLGAGTAGAFGLPIAMKLGLFAKKEKKKEPAKSDDRLSDRNKNPPAGDAVQ